MYDFIKNRISVQKVSISNFEICFYPVIMLAGHNKLIFLNFEMQVILAGHTCRVVILVNKRN